MSERSDDQAPGHGEPGRLREVPGMLYLQERPAWYDEAAGSAGRLRQCDPA